MEELLERYNLHQQSLSPECDEGEEQEGSCCAVFKLLRDSDIKVRKQVMLKAIVKKNLSVTWKMTHKRVVYWKVWCLELHWKRYVSL